MNLLQSSTRPSTNLPMMTSSNVNIFRVTGPLWGESTGDRWIPLTQRPVTWSLDAFFHLRLDKRLTKPSRSWRFETPLCSLLRHIIAMTTRLCSEQHNCVIFKIIYICNFRPKPILYYNLAISHPHIAFISVDVSFWHFSFILLWFMQYLRSIIWLKIAYIRIE